MQFISLCVTPHHGGVEMEEKEQEIMVCFLLLSFLELDTLCLLLAGSIHLKYSNGGCLAIFNFYNFLFWGL